MHMFDIPCWQFGGMSSRAWTHTIWASVAVKHLAMSFMASYKEYSGPKNYGGNEYENASLFTLFLFFPYSFSMITYFLACLILGEYNFC